MTDSTIRELGELVRAHRLEAEIIPVTGDSLATSARLAVESACTTLVAAGGDGTVSTVADVAIAHDLALGVLPLGTLNHFARDARIPSDLDAAVATLACGEAVAIDVGEVNGRIFLNNSSLGMYPRMLWEREQQTRHGRQKWTALALAALRVWQEDRRISVTIRGCEYRRAVSTPFVFIGNNEYAIEDGRIDTRPALDGGRLQVCIAPDAGRSRMARMVLSALAGRLGRFDGLEVTATSELTITGPARRVSVSLDGEFQIFESPLAYKTRPRALHVIVPKERAR